NPAQSFDFRSLIGPEESRKQGSSHREVTEKKDKSQPSRFYSFIHHTGDPSQSFGFRSLIGPEEASKKGSSHTEVAEKKETS
ncbi:hypothetical protein AVEN_7534-1, partial [Araneus ventricosus]